MKMGPKKLTLLASFLVIFFAQPAVGQTISGTITDVITKDPIKGAHIRIMELGKEYTSNDSGYYTTDTVASGTYFLKFESDHYLRHVHKVILASQKEVGTTQLVVNASLYNIGSDADKSKGNLSIKYMFPIHDIVEINIYNDRDKLVKSAFDRSRASGMRTYMWDATDNKGNPVPSGTYSCRIKSGHLLSMRSLYVKGVEAPLQ